MKTDAGELPYISVSGGAVRTAVHQKVDLHCYARRPSGGESRFGPSRLELEPSSKSVTRGSRDKLSLKIVSAVCSRREEEEELEAEEGEEPIHLDPENAYVLVVQAFWCGKPEPVSAELVLGPFEVFNHATSAVRCTPHATRRASHATRRTPHVRNPARIALPLDNPLRFISTVCFDRREPASSQMCLGRQTSTRS